MATKPFADNANVQLPEQPPASTIRLELPSDKPGDKIGSYKLLQEVGEGGMGSVWMAERQQPYLRVAIKLVKLGMDTKQVLARFRAEQQALALMDHPNIARVFEAGATENSRPYFVMELVRGISITNYCDKEKLSTKERLDLFMQVCMAIQHAHQKGVIHRDIKPSNILVTMLDGVPVPKVIDFGIAKATQGKLVDETLFTAFEQFIGTPAYMSPEQAEMNALDIDTRSDIYSLGVLLYELLSGKTPFDTKKLLEAGLDEIRRVIREEEPLRPSTRLSTLDAEEQTTVARQRHSEPPRLIHLVRGDLDWIVMKCLEKDRRRRYETANGLANDIQRHLNSEPIAARPPSRLYRFGKLARRNKLVFAAGGVVAAALIIGMGVSTWMFFKEKTARQRAVAAERNAKTEASKSQQVSKFLQDMLTGVAPSVAQGRDTTLLREVLDKTAERLGKDLKNQPDVEAELRLVLGGIYEELSDLPKAESMHRESLRLRRVLYGENHPKVGEALNDLAITLKTRGDLAGAETLYREALAIARQSFGTNHEDYAAALVNLAILQSERGEKKQAEASYREALTVFKRNSNGENEQSAEILDSLATTVMQRGDFSNAVVIAGQSLALKKKLLGEQHPSVLISLNNFANIQMQHGDFDAAEPLLRQALALQQKVMGRDHPDVGLTLANLASVLRERKDFSNAEGMYREALASFRNSIGETNKFVAGTLHNLGSVLDSQGEPNAAESVYREAVALKRGLWGNENMDVARSLNSLADVLERQGKHSEAEGIARESLAIRLKLAPEDWVTFSTRSLLGSCLLQQKKYGEAEPLLLAGCEGMRARAQAIPNAGKSRLKEAIERLIQFYRQTGQSELSAEWKKEVGGFQSSWQPVPKISSNTPGLTKCNPKLLHVHEFRYTCPRCLQYL